MFEEFKMYSDEQLFPPIEAASNTSSVKNNFLFKLAGVSDSREDIMHS